MQTGPAGIVFDTDMGNDIDDALALLVLIRAEQAGKARALLVASSNPHEWAAPGIQAILDYYGQNKVPVGASSQNVGTAMGSYTRAIAEARGLRPGEAVNAVTLMRQTLASQPDHSVRVVATGFSTNLAGLLDSPSHHAGDGIPERGVDLIRKKVEFLSIMAGNFEDPNATEFNVAENVAAFRKVIEEWPVPVYLSGYEIGIRVFSHGEYLMRTLRPENPVRAAYEFYFKEQSKEQKWDRPSWDQTAMLQAIEPGAGHFDLSDPVRITVGEKGQTVVKPAAGWDVPPRRFLRFISGKPPEKIAEILEGWYLEK